MTEFVDVVDDRGHPIRVVSRKEAHRKGLLHPGIRVLIFDKRCNIFIQQRALTKDVNPGLWEGSLAGHVHHGEHPVKAAMRETREELGLKIPEKRFRKIGTYMTQNPRDRIRYSLYVVKGVTKTPVLDPVEVLQGHWESPAHVTKHVRSNPSRYTPGFRQAWKIFSKSR